MSYLTYNKIGTPIAKIVAPDKKNKTIYLADSDKDVSHKKSKKIKYDDLDLLDNEYFSDMKMKKRFNLDKFKMNLIERNNKKVDSKLMDKTVDYINSKKDKEIIIYDGEIVPLPMKDSREIIYIAGPSGSGKSTYTSNYAREYKKMFPKNKIFVFSRVDEDTCLDKLNPIRININDQLINDPIEPKELANSLVIFDDTDTIPNKKLKEAINNLKADLLETGRHNSIHVAITSHLVSNYKETRCVLNEAHSIVLFPGAGSSYSIRYVLKNYGGLTNKDIDKILTLPSRWICFKRTFPQCISYSKGIYLLNKN